MKPSVQAQYWKNRQLKGLEISQVRESSHVFPPHFHEGIYSIGIMEKGASYCLRKGDEAGLTTAGSIALINPGQVHTGIPIGSRKVSYNMVYLSESLFRTLCFDITGQDQEWEFTNLVGERAKLRQKLFGLCQVIRSSDNLMELETSLLSVITALIPEGLYPRQIPFSAIADKNIYLAAEKLRTNLRESMDLESLSGELGVSRYHFLRCFKKVFGITPHVYRVQAKLVAAKKMMYKGVPLVDIALETGFSDQSHFSKTFLNYFGATPSQYASAAFP